MKGHSAFYEDKKVDIGWMRREVTCGWVCGSREVSQRNIIGDDAGWSTYFHVLLTSVVNVSNERLQLCSRMWILNEKTFQP